MVKDGGERWGERRMEMGEEEVRDAVCVVSCCRCVF